MSRDVRSKTLSVAGELFVRKGYAATSVADIATEVGVSKATVFYYFNSKEAIASALLEMPFHNLSDLIERAKAQKLTQRQILSAYIDGAIDSGPLIMTLTNDPSIRELMSAYSIAELCEHIVLLIAGPRPNKQDLIRARAAFAVAQTVLVDLKSDPTVLNKEARNEILAAALRALNAK